MGSPQLNPKFNIQVLPAGLVDSFADRRDLIVGQTGSGGTATDMGLVTDVQALTNAELLALFGTGDLYYSILSFRGGNGGYSPLDVIAFDPEAAQAAATAIVGITGTATANGTLTVSVIDGRRFTVTVTITTGDTATQIGNAVASALTAITNRPFTAVNSTGTVTITSLDTGAIANDYSISSTGGAAGVTIALTNWAGGGTNPSITGVFDSISGIRYTGILWPEYLQAELSTVTDLLDARFNSGSAIMDGVAFHGRSETFANARTAVSTLNSQSLVVGGSNVVTGNAAILQPAHWVLSFFQGVRARRLTPNAPISDFIVATNAPLDSIGGPALASLPYFNTPLNETPVTMPAGQFTVQEQETLETDGYTTYGVNTAGNQMIMGPVVTTWTTDAAGNVNNSFHPLNYVDTGSACREIIQRTLAATYNQSRLTSGDLVPGRKIANAESIKSELLNIYKELTRLSLTVAGTEAESTFSTGTVVTIDSSNNLVTITGPLPIVTQLGRINYALSLAFTI